MPVIPALGRQEDKEFRTSVGYTASSMTWNGYIPFKKKKGNSGAYYIRKERKRYPHSQRS
jgi:hypothetical protein